MNLDAWLDHISRQHWETMDLGLERMHDMLERLNLTRPPYSIVTIAGTNGKGSTAVALEHICLQAGLKVGTTLSPHVYRFNERMRYGGVELEDEAISNAFQAVESVRGETPLTYFEFGALAAIWIFADLGVDVAILEIGLGGRLDAFNGVDADVAVITSIDFDHQQYLGDTLEAIGREKAGILRRGQRVVLGPDMPDSILSMCAELDLDPEIYGEDFWADCGDSSWTMASRNDLPLEDLPYQPIAAQNVAVAARASTDFLGGSYEQILRQSRFPVVVGRMQRATIGGRTIVCDVAHNPAGLQFLAREIATSGLDVQSVVCGMLIDKDHEKFAGDLVSHFDAPLFLVGTGGERGMQAQALARAIEQAAETVRVCAFDKPEDALGAAMSATEAGGAILVCGSFKTLEQLPLPGA